MGYFPQQTAAQPRRTANPVVGRAIPASDVTGQWASPSSRNVSSLRSQPTNAHHRASILAGLSLTPRVPVAFALTRSARAITGDRPPLSARARLPSRGIITSFPVPISRFHFDALGWSYALPARGQAKPARLTPRPYHRALTRPAQTAALCDPGGPATRLTAPFRPAFMAQFG